MAGLLDRRRGLARHKTPLLNRRMSGCPEPRGQNGAFASPSGDTASSVRQRSSLRRRITVCARQVRWNRAAATAPMLEASRCLTSPARGLLAKMMRRGA